MIRGETNEDAVSIIVEEVAPSPDSKASTRSKPFVPLGALKQEVIRARMGFFARGFFKGLADVADETFDAPLALTYIDFANFHRLDDCGEHTVLSAKDAFADEGKVLSDVTSFAYDGLSEE